jgi:hypothetical protein
MKWRYSKWGSINVADKQGEEVEYLADALRIHNADCDTYEARLSAVLEQFGEIVCDPSCGITWTCTRCQAYARACEIAGVPKQ